MESWPYAQTFWRIFPGQLHSLRISPSIAFAQKYEDSRVFPKFLIVGVELLADIRVIPRYIWCSGADSFTFVGMNRVKDVLYMNIIIHTEDIEIAASDEKGVPFFCRGRIALRS